MGDAYLIGGYSSDFGKRPNDSYKDLTREAYLGVLGDAGMGDGADIEVCWFGNTTMYVEGQGNIRGQVCLTPLVREGRFPERVPVINVENACATGTTALAGAVKDVKAGDVNLALVICAEKLFDPQTGRGKFEAFNGAIDQFDPDEWHDYYAAAGATAGKPFETGPNRTVFMDTYAMQACHHMKEHGTTQHQFALAAAKTHNFGADNPRAQYKFRMSAEEVLGDREISFPLTRSMCAPMGDGAAALMVCSADYLKSCPASVRERAVKVKGTGMAGGKYRELGEPGLTHVAAKKAYAAAGVSPQDIDVAEVHDATSFSEVYQAEMMGFCGLGEGGRLVQDGETHLGGRIPMNTSGGLVSKGHPIGASGASMIFELMAQLRGEAGVRQVKGARLALAENGGGVIGFDEAVGVITILERA
jgi:acetyl-CoA acetyltransferase